MESDHASDRVSAINFAWRAPSVRLYVGRVVGRDRHRRDPRWPAVAGGSGGAGGGATHVLLQQSSPNRFGRPQLSRFITAQIDLELYASLITKAAHELIQGFD
jgi:hypothetical protein